MFSSDPHHHDATHSPRDPLYALTGASAVLSLLLVAASIAAFGAAFVPVAVFAVAIGLVGQGVIRSYPHAVLGACNVVTLSRAAIVAFLVGAVLHPSTPAWLVFATASVAFALDGVDGWLARRQGLISSFGARFDMETDAALAAVLALWLMTSGQTGVEVLILGFARYAFVLASFGMPRLAAELPPSFRRKAVCVVQIATLLALTCPLTPVPLAPWLSFGAAVLLSWSFAIDIRWLLRRPV